MSAGSSSRTWRADGKFFINEKNLTIFKYYTSSLENDVSQITVQFFSVDAGYFGESDSAFEKCRSRDMGCFMNITKISNWHNFWTSVWNSIELSRISRGQAK